MKLVKAVRAESLCIMVFDAIFFIPFCVVMFGRVVPLALVMRLFPSFLVARFGNRKRFDSCDMAFKLSSRSVDYALGDNSDMSCGFFSIRVDLFGLFYSEMI